MPDFDEAVLEDADALARTGGGLLRALASAGAHVRTALDRVGEFDLERVRGQTPRALLVAGDAPAAGAVRVVARLAGMAAPSVVWPRGELPRWAGPADALLVTAVEGHDMRLATLTDQAVRRGLGVVVVARSGSPVADVAGRSALAPLTGEVTLRAARWAVLTPMLQALDALGLHRGTWLPDVADALDGAAEAYRPDGDAFTNPAKSLAIELAHAQPVLAGAGPLAGCAVQDFADALGLFAGRAAQALVLPEDAARAGALLSASSTGDTDFFRDRTESAVQQPRLVLVGGDGDGEPGGDPRSDPRQDPDELAARRAASALQTIALQAGVRSSVVEVPAGAPLARYAVAAAFGDFTAAYLALGLGVDPTASRPGEWGS